MSIYLTSSFWTGAAERAVKTFAQAALAVIGTNTVAITSLDWLHILAVAALAAVVSLLTSVATPDTASNSKKVQVEMLAFDPPVLDDPEARTNAAEADRAAADAAGSSLEDGEDA